MKKYWNVLKYILICGTGLILACGAYWLYLNYSWDRERDAYNARIHKTNPPSLDYYVQQAAREEAILKRVKEEGASKVLYELGYGKYRHDYDISPDNFLKDPESYHINTKYMDKFDWVEWPMRIIVCAMALALVLFLIIYIFLVIKKNFGTKMKRFYDDHLKV